MTAAADAGEPTDKVPVKGVTVMRKLVVRVLVRLKHLYGRISRKYYCEDFVRVYPNGICINRRGRQRSAKPGDINNFLNHQKFYAFAAQFACGATVADIGCGSGYGCALLKNTGATVSAAPMLQRMPFGSPRNITAT